MEYELLLVVLLSIEHMVHDLSILREVHSLAFFLSHDQTVQPFSNELVLVPEQLWHISY